MPLGELNEYMDKKLNRHREVENTIVTIKALQGKEAQIIPIAMKNGMDISMRQFTRINYFNENSNGLGHSINKLIVESKTKEQGIGQIEERSKSVSNTLKQGDIRVKEEYKELLRELSNLTSCFNAQGDSR